MARFENLTRVETERGYDPHDPVATRFWQSYFKGMPEGVDVWLLEDGTATLEEPDEYRLYLRGAHELPNLTLAEAQAMAAALSAVYGPDTVYDNETGGFL